MQTVAHIISHTHWDREWYLNSPYTREWLVPFFDGLFRLLDAEPDSRFVLDGQSCMIDDYREELLRLGRSPEAAEARLRRHASSGRLVVGPYYLQPDWNLASDESLVRNLLIGIRDAEAFGGSMRTGWLLDNFGQISQTVQLHAGFGIRDLFVWRGVEMQPDRLSSEFIWRSPDGSTARCVYLVASYRNAMRLGSGGIMYIRRVMNEVGKVRPFASSPNVLLMNGYDQEMEPENIPAMIREIGGCAGEVTVRQSTPGEYVQAVFRKAVDIPVLSGPLYGGSYIAVFPGVLSARSYLKTANDACQRLVERAAEPFAVMAWLCGSVYPQERFYALWKRLLRNHPHDSICGVSVDDVHRDMERRFSGVAAEASAIARESIAAVAAALDAPDGVPALLVLNPTPVCRPAIIRVPGNLAGGMVPCAGDGTALERQSAAGGDLYVRIRELPGFGYAALPLSASAAGCAVDDPVAVSAATLENAALRVTVHADGTLDILDKRADRTYRKVGSFEDGADNGDSYDYAYPEHDQVIRTSRVLSIRIEEQGPLVGTLEVTEELSIPASLSSDRTGRSSDHAVLGITRRISLRSGESLVRLDVEVRNTAEDHRLRMFFPLGAAAEESFAGAPFSIERFPITAPMIDPERIPEDVRRVIIGARAPRPASFFPFKRFVGIASGSRGVIAFARGLSEFEVVEGGAALAVTLFRSVGWLARTDLSTRIGDAGPMIAVPDAQCLRTMRFSLGVAFASERNLTERMVSLHETFVDDYAITPVRIAAADRPVHVSWLSLGDQGGKVLWTAIKLAEAGDGLIVRFCNPTGSVLFPALASGIRGIRMSAADLNESPRENVESNGLPALRPAEIRTVLVKFPDPGRPASGHTPAEKPAGPVYLSASDARVERGLEPDTEPVRSRLKAVLAGESVRALSLEDVHRKAAPAAEPASDEAARVLGALSEAGARRTALEARLSVLLLQKRLSGSSPELENALRELGLKLNHARIDKRLLEYVKDCVETAASADVQ